MSSILRRAFKINIDGYEDDIFHESSYPIFGGERSQLGFIFPDIQKQSDIVFLGCSITYGQGVPEGLSWTSFIKEKTNMTCNNLSGPGRSVQWTINNFFSYVHKFGNPKIVLALFPEFSRITMSSTKNMKSKYIDLDNFPENLIVYRYPLYEFFEDQDTSKYFKSPLIAEHVISGYLGFDLSMQYIKMLELYCNSNGIELLWGTWDDWQNNWLSNNIFKTEFKNFIDTKTSGWHNRQKDMNYDILCSLKHDKQDLCSTQLVCHKKEKEIYGVNFFKANDFVEGIKNSHWGVHRHIHTAELFLNNIQGEK